MKPIWGWWRGASCCGRVRLAWPDVEGLRVLGYGYATPFLRPFLIEAERTVAAMPAQMGVTGWPGSKCLTTQVEEDALAFPDAFFDRILVVHGVEGGGKPASAAAPALAGPGAGRASCC